MRNQEKESAADAEDLVLVELPPSDSTTDIRMTPCMVEAEILDHTKLSAGHFHLRLHAPAIARGALPGQFVMLTVALPTEVAPVLPRPMALYDWDVDRGSIDVVYRVMGDGTRLLSSRRPGQRLVTVGPLGRAFLMGPAVTSALFIGRGIGICSLTALSAEARRRNISTTVVSSARDQAAIVGSDLYRSVGVGSLLEVTDADETSSVANVDSLLRSVTQDGHSFDYIAVCGSNRLLRLAADWGARCDAEVQVSVEAHMACGLGYCHGCSSGSTNLAKEDPLVCRDGPVFRVGP